MVQPGQQQSAEQLRLLWRITAMAFALSAEVAAGALIGWLVDRWRGAGDQLGLYIGGVAGIVVGLYGFLSAAFKLSRRTGPGPGRPGDRPPPQEGT